MKISIAEEELVAYADLKLLPFPTIRHVDCHVVLHPSLKGPRCVPCINYRPSLRSFQLRQRNENMDTSSSSKTNERWMSSEELKRKIHSLKKKNQKATVAKLKRTQGKLAKLIEEESILIPLNPTPAPNISSRRSHSSSLHAGSVGEGEV